MTLRIHSRVPALLSAGCFFLSSLEGSAGGEGESASPSESAASTGPARGKPVIPAGKGSTTEAGIFVPIPAPAGPDKSPSTGREEAEKQLRAAFKVEELKPGKFRLGMVSFDSKARTVSLPAKVNMRSGLVEYVLTTEAGKTHEALLTTAASPRDVHTACLLLGMNASPPAAGWGPAAGEKRHHIRVMGNERAAKESAADIPAWPSQRHPRRALHSRGRRTVALLGLRLLRLRGIRRR